MASSIGRALLKATVFAYGLFTLGLYGLTAIVRGTYFKWPSEKDKLELKVCRNAFWNLSKDWFDWQHRFLTLRSGFKFHYVCNDKGGAAGTAALERPLVILIHGFPDSWALWRHIMKGSFSDAVVVAVDLPGYGGSDSLDEYSATNVLEALTEFIIAMRMRYGVDKEGESNLKKTIIVAHDWGCVLSMRLAAEAPQLADRFILTNGPLPKLAESNIRRRLSSSAKMWKSFWAAPLHSRSTLWKAIHTMLPIFRQLLLSGYIFAMQMPPLFVRYLGVGGNASFLQGAHKTAHTGSVFTNVERAESMAISLGPSKLECETKTADGEQYPASVARAGPASKFEHMTAYYRDGASTKPWHKSIETIGDLHSINRDVDMRTSSVGAGLFDDAPEGVLKAPCTILWGMKDIALDQRVCLDGIADYLTHGSQVVQLPRSGHFTPIEQESRKAIKEAIDWAMEGEHKDLGAVMDACYPGAGVTVRK